MTTDNTTEWPANLHRWEAARYLTEVHGIPVAAATLAHWFSGRFDGPPVFKVGNIPYYPRAELDKWAKERIAGLSYHSSYRRRAK